MEWIDGGCLSMDKIDTHIHEYEDSPIAEAMKSVPR
jgi:hypothetical protein